MQTISVRKYAPGGALVSDVDGSGVGKFYVRDGFGRVIDEMNADPSTADPTQIVHRWRGYDTLDRVDLGGSAVRSEPAGVRQADRDLPGPAVDGRTAIRQHGPRDGRGQLALRERAADSNPSSPFTRRMCMTTRIERSRRQSGAIRRASPPSTRSAGRCRINYPTVRRARPSGARSPTETSKT